MKRKYGPTAKRPAVTPGQIWKSSQKRDVGRCVRIAAVKRGRIALVPENDSTGERRLRSSMSEKTLRKVYALVGFSIVDEWAGTVADGLTFSEALQRRMRMWKRRPRDVLAIFGVNNDMVCAPLTAAEARAAR